MHRSKGTFCYGFYSPRQPPRGSRRALPRHDHRPGVTPDVSWESAALGAYDQAFDLEQHAFQKEFLAGDSLCRAV